jgi:hypothetical protein
MRGDQTVDDMKRGEGRRTRQVEDSTRRGCHSEHHESLLPPSYRHCCFRDRSFHCCHFKLIVVCACRCHHCHSHCCCSCRHCRHSRSCCCRHRRCPVTVLAAATAVVVHCTLVSPPPCRCPLSPPFNAISILHCHRCCCHSSPPSNTNDHRCPSPPSFLSLPATFAANHQPLPSEGICASHHP